MTGVFFNFIFGKEMKLFRPVAGKMDAHFARWD